MENVMTIEGAAEGTAEFIVDFVVDRVIEKLAERLEREPGSEHWVAEKPAADLRYEDDPEALDEPRPAQGLPLDLTGFVFGKLTAIERSRPGYWRVRCSCGICKEVSREALRTGSARSCGCVRLGLKPLQAHIVNLMGQHFGSLTVVGRARPRGKSAMWRCRCSCGKFANYRSDRLRSGHTTSCGCVARAAQFAPGNTIGQAVWVRPGTNLIPSDERVRDELLAEFRDRGATTDGRWFHFTRGVSVRQGELRSRIVKRLGLVRTPMDRAAKLRIGRIFKSIVAGLPKAASSEQHEAA
jgi:hypothetical protein